MKGHHALIAMRNKGKTPSIVFVETTNDRLRQAAAWQQLNPGMAQILIEPEDVPAMLDLRCVVGLLVSISGDCAELVGRVHDACLEAGAKRVISSVCQLGRYGRELTRISDTEGILTWQM